MKKTFSLVALALLSASLSARTDVTDTYLTNGGLTSLDGWTLDANAGMAKGAYQDYKTDGAVPVIEFYHDWNANAGTAIGSTKTFNFSQTPTLPAGYYRLQVNAFYREGNGNGTNEKAYIYAGEKQQYVVGLSSAGVASYDGSADIYRAATAFSLGDFSNEFDFKVESEAAVELGFHGYIDTYCSWCILGPVHLYQYTVDDYIEAYNTQYAAAEAIKDSKMNASVQSALASAMVDAASLTEIDAVIAAEAALKAAVADANTSIAAYAATKAALDKYAAMVPSEAAIYYNVADIETAYNDGSMTDDQSAAVVAAFKVAAKYIYSDGSDVTALASAWTAAQGNGPKTFQTGYETYSESAYEAGKVFYQYIDGLIPGTAYTVQFYATANMAWIGAATGDGIAQVYANGATYDISVIGQTGCTLVSDDYLREFQTTVGKDGVLEFGMQNVATGGNWYVAQVKSIVSAGNTNVASYATTYVGIDAIRAAISAANETVAAGTYADIVAAYTAKFDSLSAVVNRVAFVADSLYAEVAISGKADSLVALLPAVTEVDDFVAPYQAEVKALTPEETEEVGEKTLVEVYDFAAFVAGGAPTLTLGEEAIAQSGTNALDVYKIQNPTNNNGVTLKLNDRFAINAGPTAALTLRWMWRANASAGREYQNGLAGNWNGNGASAVSYNLSILNMLYGDTIVVNYSMQSGKAAQLYTCADNVLATTDGTALAAGTIVASGTKYVVKKAGNIDLYDTNNNMAIQSITLYTEPKKIQVTDVFDFAAFVAGGAPTLTLDEEAIAQSGTNALDVYKINDPTNTAGVTLKLKNRFAINAGPTAALTLRWMWRANASAGREYQNGLAGNWNGNGASAVSYNLSVLNLEKGDSIVFNYSMQSGKAAQLYTCADNVLATADGTALAAGEIVASGVKYVVLKKGNLDLYDTNNNMAIQSVAITYMSASLPAPSIVSEGESSGAVKVSVADAEGTVYYSLDEGEPQVYTKPFYITSSANVSAWYETDVLASMVAETRVFAGEIAAPVVKAVAANEGERTVSISSTTAAAYLVVNGDSVDNNYTTTISSDTEFAVVAKTKTVTEDAVFVIASDSTIVSIAAGTTLQLNQVTFSVVEQSDTLYKVLLNNSNADLVGAPTAAISYELYPSGEKFDYTVGDTLKVATHQRITAVANAEGYATSEPAVMWTREPAKLELVWADDFKTPASENLASGNSYTAVLQEATFTATGSYGTYDMCPVQYLDGMVSNSNFGVQSGTSWLERNASGYLGLYNFNSGPRRFGINNLRKTQVVKLTVQDPAQVAIENDVLELDAANSVGNTLYYNCVKDGAAVLSMTRYYCIWAVEVYNNPDVTPSPNVYIAGKEESGERDVVVVPATFPYEDNAWTYYAVANGVRYDSTLVAEATETTEAVYDVDTVTVFGDFQLFTEPIKVSAPNNTIVAYTEYEGKASEMNYVTIDCDSIFQLSTPVITWVEKTDEGHVFTIADKNLVEAGLYADLNYTYNDETGILNGETNTLTLAGNGWLTVKAVLPGMDTAYVVSRYVASARESYNEAYASIIDGDTLTLSNISGDFESAAGANVVGEYPASKIAVGGTQYVHVNVTDNYTAFAAPFAISIGTNVITNASGEALQLGVDYQILTLHVRTAQNSVSNKDLTQLVNSTNISSAVRAEGVEVMAGVPLMIQSLSEKVGNEIIIQNYASAPVASAFGSTTVPTNGGWRLFANGNYQKAALTSSAYVMNEDGTKFVYTENPTVEGLGVAIIVDPSAVATLGQEIDLVADPAGIETVAEEVEAGAIFDVMGRKAQKLQKGQIYISKGATVIVK